MNEIVKICKKHGKLAKKDVYLYKKLVCKKCNNEYHNKYRRKHPEGQRAYARKYSQNNKEKIKFKNKVYRQNFSLEQRKDKFKKTKLTLSDDYIKHLIIGKSKILKYKNIPKELIEVKRLHLKLTRKLKELKNVNK